MKEGKSRVLQHRDGWPAGWIRSGVCGMVDRLRRARPGLRRGLSLLGILALWGAVVVQAAEPVLLAEPVTTVDRVPSVGVYGAVRQPGQIELEAAHTDVQSALAAAGGLAPDAFAFGAILLRRDRSDGSAVVIPTTRSCVEPGERQALAVIDALFGVDDRREWARRLSSRQLYRVPVQLNGSAPGSEPVSLIAGDVLIIPPRQAYVYVAQGYALEAAPTLYQAGAGGDHYFDALDIDGSGWFGKDLLVLPDGQARVLGLKFWNYERTAIPPGSLLISGVRKAGCSGQ